MIIDEFVSELQKLGINITDYQLQQLEQYYNILIEQNKVMNLTRIIEKEEVYLKHFYDSLTLCKIVNLSKNKKVCDIGSGAGFPGIVIKIFYPELEIVLVDSLNKRINFLNTVIKELELKKITTIHSRIEEYAIKNKEKFDVVTARAVAPLNILLELGINLVKVGKYFVAMKGNIENEPDYSKAIEKLDCSLGNIVKFKLPIEESNRNLIKIIKQKSTSKIFPRKHSEIKKKPL